MLLVDYVTIILQAQFSEAQRQAATITIDGIIYTITYDSREFLVLCNEEASTYKTLAEAIDCICNGKRSFVGGTNFSLDITTKLC